MEKTYTDFKKWAKKWFLVNTISYESRYEDKLPSDIIFSDIWVTPAGEQVQAVVMRDDSFYIGGKQSLKSSL